MKFELPQLEYDYNALEPFIDARTMEIHYSKHHQGYVTKLNAALEGHEDLVNKDLEDLLTDLDVVPQEVRAAVQNNGGGHYNHSLFWTLMTPDTAKRELVNEHLSQAITMSFGSVDNLKEEFIKAALGVFGSGWAWLISEDEEKLSLLTTANQNTPITLGKTPILGVDVWEHAYYLKYQNLRQDYLENWWQVVNWNRVGELYENSNA